jgi:predicted nucleic acid-binding protein
MRLIVADTSPINYLILIGQQDLLARLYGQIVVPQAVLEELTDPRSPTAVRGWLESYPAWFVVAPETNTQREEQSLEGLDRGESAAILLAQELHADLILIDERPASSLARLRGLETIGTLGVLQEAARRGWIDLRKAVADLRGTNFRISPPLIRALLNPPESGSNT